MARWRAAAPGSWSSGSRYRGRAGLAGLDLDLEAVDEAGRAEEERHPVAAGPAQPRHGLIRAGPLPLMEDEIQEDRRPDQLPAGVRLHLLDAGGWIDRLPRRQRLHPGR